MIIFNEQKFKLKVFSMGDGGGDGDVTPLDLPNIPTPEQVTGGAVPMDVPGVAISAEEPAAAKEPAAVKGKGALSTVGKGALTGLTVAGIPGAILGAVIGLGVSAAQGDFGTLGAGEAGAGEIGPGGEGIPAGGVTGMGPVSDINIRPPEPMRAGITGTQEKRAATKPAEDISQTPEAAAEVAEEELRRRRRARFGYWQTRTGAGADMASMLWSPTLYPTVAA